MTRVSPCKLDCKFITWHCLMQRETFKSYSSNTNFVLVPEKFLVVRDGTIREIDHDGDIEMVDSPPMSPERRLSLIPSSFDGAFPVIESDTARKQLSYRLAQRLVQRSGIDWVHNSVDYDEDRDVIRQSIVGTSSGEMARHSFEAVAYTRLRKRVEGTEDARLRGMGWDEVLIGITRIDIALR